MSRRARRPGRMQSASRCSKSSVRGLCWMERGQRSRRFGCAERGRRRPQGCFLQHARCLTRPVVLLDRAVSENDSAGTFCGKPGCHSRPPRGGSIASRVGVFHSSLDSTLPRSLIPTRATHTHAALCSRVKRVEVIIETGRRRVRARVPVPCAAPSLQSDARKKFRTRSQVRVQALGSCKE